VGNNIFTHESGIHVAAILENQYTYEPISPELVGNKRRIVLGKHSGRHMVKKILTDHNIDTTEQNIEKIIKQIKEFGEQNGIVSNEEIYHMIKELEGIS
jgi:isopropylmalate/homocitrate/citramalate synthase